jgi:hypothetical protein
VSVTAFVEQLNSVGPHRMLDLYKAGTVGGYYVLLGPSGKPGAAANRNQWHDVDQLSAVHVPRWAWYVCTQDQAKDVAEIEDLDFEFKPTGWVLNIEKWLEGVKLDTLIPKVSLLGKPIVASLGGSQSASHIWLDYRTMDNYKVTCNWQAYFDSGEGVTPARAVQELYQSTFIIAGWEYRARFGDKFGWGKVSRVEAAQKAVFDSYKYPTKDDGWFSVAARDWGYTVVSRSLFRNGHAGLVYGRAAYNRIAVTLDVTRTAQARAPEEWAPIAASARVPGAARRPVSIYLLDNCSDEVARAIAAGAG